MKHGVVWLSIIVLLLAAFLAACEDSSDSDNTVDGDAKTDGDLEQSPDGDKDVEGEESSEYPDPAFIYEVRQSPVNAKDEKYFQKFTDFYRTTDRLPVLDLHALAAIDGTVYAASADRVFMKTAEAAAFVEITLPGQVVRKTRVEDGDIDTAETPEAEVEAEAEIVAEEETQAEAEIAHEAEPEVEAVTETEIIPEIELEAEAETEPVASEIVDIARSLLSGKLVVAFTDKIVVVNPSDSQGSVLSFPNGGVTSVTVDGSKLVVGAKQGVFRFDSLCDGCEQPVLTTLEVRDVVVLDGSVILAATPEGVKRIAGESVTDFAASLPDNDVRALAVCGGKVAIGTATAVVVKDGAETRAMIAQKDGLPNDQVLNLDCDGEHILVGHAVGASYLDLALTKAEFFLGGRWIPESDSDYLLSNRIPAVALDGGNRWLGAKGGASRIYHVERTLADKELVFDSYVQHFWRMDGFFSSDGWVPEGAFASMDGMTKSDKDNDGLWTQMMIGGWCYAYAVTGEKKYYDYARKAMDNMFKLIDYPAISFEALGKKRGFVARSIVREDEGTVFSYKDTEKEKVGGKDILRWNPVTVDGTRYLWKADTSSDETTGHFFGFPVFYDLCAQTAEEKAEVAEHAGALAEYIVDNDFWLLDLDGTPTTWGRWHPSYVAIAVDGLDKCMAAHPDIDEKLSCVNSSRGAGWLNSIEILSHLLAAWHMTGNTKLYDAYEKLINEYRYDEMAMPNEDTWTITNPAFANHSDHELAMLAYTSLIRYEPNAERRANWVKSLKFLYDSERPERNPWWAAVYAVSGGADPDAENALRTLREIPDDIRDWKVDNSVRKDAVVIGEQRNGGKQFDRAYPFDEIRTMWWNGNPFSVTDGGSGASYQAPTAWLLPYYMGLYSGLITK